MNPQRSHGVCRCEHQSMCEQRLLITFRLLFLYRLSYAIHLHPPLGTNTLWPFLPIMLCSSSSLYSLLSPSQSCRFSSPISARIILLSVHFLLLLNSHTLSIFLHSTQVLHNFIASPSVSQSYHFHHFIPTQVGGLLCMCVY